MVAEAGLGIAALIKFDDSANGGGTKRHDGDGPDSLPRNIGVGGKDDTVGSQKIGFGLADEPAQ